jgi:DNA invertase Pin-like site-specific DNA recombinase
MLPTLSNYRAGSGIALAESSLEMMAIEWDEPIKEQLSPDRIRAAQCVRMSTDQQEFSTDNQAAAIAYYVERHGYDIARPYADEGKNGLDLGGRSGLQQVLADAEKGVADCSALLVYDVSRLGRFQDSDEAATYELRLRRAGVAVEYCSEHFENDGSMGSSIVKTVKRAMAGKYSRELSVKVFAGQANLIRLGVPARRCRRFRAASTARRPERLAENPARSRRAEEHRHRSQHPRLWPRGRVGDRPRSTGFAGQAIVTGTTPKGALRIVLDQRASRADA